MKSNELETAIKTNPRAWSLNAGRVRDSPELEEELAGWIVEGWVQAIVVTTNQVIAQAIFVDPNFCHGNRKVMWGRMYPLLQRHRLNIRNRTRVGQTN